MHGDIAAVILEPVGSLTGQVPHPLGFLNCLREVTRSKGALLICNKVVTGFRVSPGGAQAYYGVLPGLTTLANILSSSEAWQYQSRSPGNLKCQSHDGGGRRGSSYPHRGNGRFDQASKSAEALRNDLNTVIEDDGVQWAAYGEFSAFHKFTNPNGRVIKCDAFDPLDYGFKELTTKPEKVIYKPCPAMLINGGDFTDWPSGTVSISHTAEDISATAEVFSQALHVLRPRR